MPSHNTTITPEFSPVLTYILPPRRVTGAMKPEYGTYSVELDGRVALNTSSFSRTQLFRQRLFRLRDLSNGPHVIRVINTGNRGTGFDVDTVSCYPPCGCHKRADEPPSTSSPFSPYRRPHRRPQQAI